MTYQERFREKFPYTISKLGELRTADILTFIEDECTEVGSKALYEGQKLGRAAEREELAAYVEGMYGEVKGGCEKHGWSKEAAKHCVWCIRNKHFRTAYSKILAHLRQSGEEHQIIEAEGRLDFYCTKCGRYGEDYDEMAGTKCEPRQSDAPQVERVCEQNCPDFSGMAVLHAEQCTCSCHKKAPQGDSVEGENN